MAMYSAGVRTGAGSTTLPQISLYAAAAVAARVWEIGVCSTFSTASSIKLVRLTTAGTQGAGLTEARHEDSSQVAASCTAFTTHTGAPTLGDDLGYRFALGAAVGTGIVWTFGPKGLLIPVGTANGVGVIVSTGSGQAIDAWIVWEE